MSHYLSSGAERQFIRLDQRQLKENHKKQIKAKQKGPSKHCIILHIHYMYTNRHCLINIDGIYLISMKIKIDQNKNKNLNFLNLMII